ncbi:hypothetical protein, partial [Polaromonas jejuensis]
HAARQSDRGVAAASLAGRPVGSRLIVSHGHHWVVNMGCPHAYDRSWPGAGAGAAIIEIGATLPTPTCRSQRLVWSEHFEWVYVSSQS